MKIQVERQGRQLSEADLVAFEQKIGRAIPAEYRSFLLVNNGGFPDPGGFSVIQDGREQPVSIKRLLGIDMAEPTLNIENVLTVFRGRLSAAFFPIARDPGGNFVGIVTEGDGEGVVVYCDLEYEEDEGIMPIDRMFPIAPSFSAFLDNLTE